ncbi:MAG: AbrB/MazE/SpoVT family DNA-binding domain-containing protein [Candidatus Njordarchaeales archaeon]
MEKIVRIDNKGRVLIPKKIREKLSLDEYRLVSIRVEGNRIILEPVRSVKKVRGKVFEEAFFDAGKATYGQ